MSNWISTCASSWREATPDSLSDVLRSAPRYVLDDPHPVGTRRASDVLVLTAKAGKTLDELGAPVTFDAPHHADGCRVPRYVAVVFDTLQAVGEDVRAHVALPMLFAKLVADAEFASALCTVHMVAGARATFALMHAWYGTKKTTKARARRKA